MEHVARTESRRPAPATTMAARRARRRRPLLALCVTMALLLGAAAAVDGELGVTLLAIWVGVFATLGWRTSAPTRPRRVRLVIGELTVHGEVGEPRTLAVVPSRRAAKVLRSRPRG